MRAKGNKLIALYFIFSVFALSGNVYAKKHGAELKVYMKNGQTIGGELIVVKIQQESLLLLESESGADVSISIKDVDSITIVKESKVLQGVGFGLFIGGVSGALFGFIQEGRGAFVFFNWFIPKKERPENILGGIVGGGVTGSLLGGIIGALDGTDEKIQVEGSPDSRIKILLADLRRKARIPKYR